MHYKILLTKSFERDLDNTLFYITTKLLNRIAAKNLLKKTKDTINMLTDNPSAFPVYHGTSNVKYDYRYILVGNYIIFYRIDESSKTVYIMRFLYSGQDIEKLI